MIGGGHNTFYAARVAGEYITCVEPGRSLHKKMGYQVDGAKYRPDGRAGRAVRRLRARKCTGDVHLSSCAVSVLGVGWKRTTVSKIQGGTYPRSRMQIKRCLEETRSAIDVRK